LGFGAQETIDDTPADGEAVVLDTLRRGEGGPGRFVLSLAEAHAHGASFDWQAGFATAAAKTVPLPTYPFQRRRYWLEPRGRDSDARALGQGPAEHPLLGASLSTAVGRQLLLTGRISHASHPWLADHAVAGATLLPAGVFLELALRAGDEADCETVEELELADPAVLEPEGAIQIQVTVTEPDGEGKRAISIHTRPEPGPEDWEEDGPGWACNARGSLRDAAVEVVAPPGAWPPAGAEPLDVEGLYDQLADRGIELGAAFQGVEVAWRGPDGICAEIAPVEEQADGSPGFGMHPAQLQAALQLASLPGDGAAGEVARLPASIRAASLRPGAAGGLRVWLTAQDGATVSLGFAAADGTPLGSVRGLATGPVPAGQLEQARRRQASLLRLDWLEVEAPTDQGGIDPDFVVEGPFAADGEDVPRAAQAAAKRTLELLQGWIAEERSSDSRLAILTHRAVAVGGNEAIDMAAAPIWGLVRSAQAEHPDSFVLIDSDDSKLSRERVSEALRAAVNEPQLAIREGRLLAPRLARTAVGEHQPQAFDSESTVLVSGGSDGLGALVSAHVVEEHGARHLLFACASAEEVTAAAELKERLAAVGCEVRIESCDPADREQLRALLASIDPTHPLSTVIHAARVLDDGVLGSLDSKRLERTMRPKVDAAWNLHELTGGMELSGFLLFSSAVSILGGPAQANYAAANAFLDGLAAHRHDHGLPATSLAWGLVGTGEELDETVRARMASAGLAAIEPARALELFDLARGAKEAVLAPIALDAPGLRAQARDGLLPAVMRGLVPGAARRAREQGSLVARLAGVPSDQHPAIVEELVRGQVAAILGHSSSSDVELDRPFLDLGFDSLAAVTLRNRLGAATGLRLPSTLAFDHPSPAAVAAYLTAEVAAAGGAKTPEAEVEEALAGLEASLAAVGDERGARERIGMRLRAALAGLSGVAEEAGEADETSEDLAALSHDEVFALIDEEVDDG
jgi:short-subunit dehydrogenase/acyl carrier protein